MIRNTDGYHIYGWMVNELHLEGGDLLAFAIVYPYVKAFAGKYTGNTAYLSEWTGWAMNTSRSHLANLVSRGLLVEERGRDKNAPFCHYLLAPDFYSKHTSIIEVQDRKNCAAKIEGMAPQKLGHNIKDIKENKEYKFTPPTLEEVAAYARQRGFVSPEGFAYKFITYYELNNWHLANGKPMKDWKRAVLTWEPESKTKKYPVPPSLLKQATTQEITAWLR